MRTFTFIFSFMTLTINIVYCQINLSVEGVGINRSAPVKGLAIKGGNGGNINIDNTGEQYNDIDFLNIGTRKALLGLDNSSNVFRIVSEKSDQDFSIQTGGFNERFRIKSTGQIGIGMQSWQDYKVSINADNVLNPIVLYNDKNQLSLIDFWNISTGANAGISNRFVTNKPNAVNTWNVASIDKYRTGLWAFRNYDSNGRIEFDLQGITGNTTPELVIENDGGVKIPSAGIKFGGTPIAGSMRWTGSDFEGYNGSQWKSLINNQGPPQTLWVTYSVGYGCNICPSGYTPSPDANGSVCKTIGGQGSNYTTQPFGQVWRCGDSYQLAQCHCVRVN
jgi:hypothetical protein